MDNTVLLLFGLVLCKLKWYNSMPEVLIVRIFTVHEYFLIKGS